MAHKKRRVSARVRRERKEWLWAVVALVVATPFAVLVAALVGVALTPH